MPRHWWIVLGASDCNDKKKKLRTLLGSKAVVRVWSGKKKQRCYAIVAGPVDGIPDDMLADPVKLPPVLLIDDDDANDDDLGDVA